MSTQAFGVSIKVEPSVLSSPSPVLQKPTLAPNSSMDIEMIPLSQDAGRKDSARKTKNTAEAPVISKSPNELEMSRPSSPQGGRSVDVVQTFWNPYMNRFRLAAACVISLGLGMNDSSSGALLAYIEKQEDYNIGYAIVSIIFVSQALGFAGAAFVVNTLALRFGRAKTLVVAEALIIAGYVCLVTTPPFPVVVIGFFIAGIGMAMNLAITQVFVSNLASSTTLLGIFQGCYGIGGVIGPLIATSLVSRGVSWSRYYLLTLGIAVIRVFSSSWSFWHYERDTLLPLMSTLEQTASRQQASANAVGNSKGKWQSFKAILGNKPTFLGALFIFAYQGAEVSISGWVISFLVQYRNGDLTRVGYVTAGFWGGITLGRFLLAHSVHYLGERKFVFALSAGALVLELLVWFVPSIPGDSVAVALSGFLLGPIYPSAASLFARLIPRQMQVSSFSFIASIGSSGGAMAPFITGILAQQFGTFVLHPICIGLFAAMAGCWWLLPKAEKKSE